MTQLGISILLRAGNNKQAAQKVLQQLVDINTHRPVEVVVLFNEPQAKHLQLTRAFAGRLPLVIRPAKGRTFANVTRQLRYDQVLILTTPLEIKADVLPEAAKQLRNSDKGYLVLDAPKQALLVTQQAVERLDEHLLTAAANTLQQAMDGKVAQAQTPQQPQAQAKKGQPAKVPPEKTQAKPAAAKSAPKQATAPDNAPLDREIAELEQELERLDQSLSDQYAEIERMDTQYEALPAKGDNTAQALKQQLKERVFQANDTLKALKQRHDDLERLRIRRFSIVA